MNSERHDLKTTVLDEQTKLTELEIDQEGERLKLTLVTLGAHECLTIGETAKLYDVSESTIRDHIKRHVIGTTPVTLSLLKQLRQENVVSIHASKTVLIPRYGLRQLMKVINTKRSWSAFDKLFNDAEELIVVKQKLSTLESTILATSTKIIHVEHERDVAIAKLEALVAEVLTDERIDAVEFNLEGMDAFGWPRFKAMKILKEVLRKIPTSARYKVEHIATILPGSCKSLRNLSAILNINDPDVLSEMDRMVDLADSIKAKVLNSDSPIFEQ